MRRISETILLAVVGVVAVPSAAFACSWDWCGDPAYVVPTDKQHLPANGSMLYVPLRSGTAETAIDALELTDQTTGTPVDLVVEVADIPHFYGGWMEVYTVTPATPLSVGETYVLSTATTRADSCEPSTTINVSVIADEIAEAPTALGTIAVASAERRMEELAEDGGCSWEQDVHVVRIAADLDPSMRPWADIVAFETLVDGEPWYPSSSSGAGYSPGSSWVGRGIDDIFAICNDDPYSEHSWLMPGTYEVQMRARVPGLEGVWESNKLTITLDCSDNPVVEPDPNNPDGPGPDEDPVPGDDPMQPGGAEGDKSEAGCSTAGSPPMSLLGLLGLVALGRRRRR